MRSSFLSFGVILSLSLMSLPSFAQEVSAETTLIQKYNTALMAASDVTKDSGYDSCKVQMTPIIEEIYNLPMMAKMALGSQYKKLSAKDQQKYLAAFKAYSIASYTSRFCVDSKPSISVTDEKETEDGNVIVSTKMASADSSDSFEISYLMSRDGNDKPSVVDVYLGGTISQLAMRRSEYSSFLNRNGFEKFLEEFDIQIRDLEKNVRTKAPATNSNTQQMERETLQETVETEEE